MKARSILITALVAAAVMGAGVAAAQDKYADGSKVNLATIRGNVATASVPVGSSQVWSPMRPAHDNEIRFGTQPGPVWWQVEFPDI